MPDEYLDGLPRSWPQVAGSGEASRLDTAVTALRAIAAMPPVRGMNGKVYDAEQKVARQALEVMGLGRA